MVIGGAKTFASQRVLVAENAPIWSAQTNTNPYLAVTPYGRIKTDVKIYEQL
ncbi:MAG: hypothetical protein Q8N13_21220 [Acidovorax sp.]|nr:hypothetical protein [Acidovorax sp.]